MSTETFEFVDPDHRGSTNVDGLPPSLKEHPIWVVEEDKQPCYPSWKWNREDGPETTTFEDARTELEQRLGSSRAGNGLGVIIQPSNDLVVIDGDSVVREDGEILPDFRPILDAANSYAEYSTSGKGIHIIVGGVEGLQSDRKTRYDYEEPWADGELPHIDLFGSQEARNVVLTGDSVGDNRTIRDSPRFVRELHEQFPQRVTTTTSKQVHNPIDGKALDFEQQEDYGPASVRATIETYAEYGSGEAQSHAERILALWNAQPSENPRDASTHSETVAGVRYNSPSEADWDFVTGLAYYCRGDKALMEDCWRDSARWSRPEKEKSEIYYHKTIESASKSSTTRISRRNITEVSQ